jgi:hypothetical protein
MTTPQKIPPPSLEDLVQKYGGWDRVPPEAWKKYEAERKAWQDRIRFGEHWVKS